MAQYLFRIRKLSDRDIVARFVQLQEENIFPFGRVDYFIPFLNHKDNDSVGPNWHQEEILKGLGDTTRLFSHLHIYFQNDVQVNFSRDTNPLSDSVNIVVPDNLENIPKEQLFRLLERTRRIFEEFEPAMWNLDRLGTEVKELYEAREQHLSLQERRMSQFFFEIEKFTMKLTTEHQQRASELEKRHVERQNELEAQYTAQMKALSEREAEFEQRKAEFDMRESRAVRRSIRDKLKEEFQKRSMSFSLTEDTKRRGWPVLIGYVVAILVLGMTTALFIAEGMRNPDRTQDWLLITRQVGFGAATVAFLTLFIRWSNAWFQRHANEEFRLKRMDIDIDRASWLVEMAMEWKKENQSDIPPELLKELARNLFIDDQTGTDSLAGDTPLSALLGAASRLKLSGKDGLEAEWDRSGVKKIDGLR